MKHSFPYLRELNNLFAAKENMKHEPFCSAFSLTEELFLIVFCIRERMLKEVQRVLKACCKNSRASNKIRLRRLEPPIHLFLNICLM